GAHFEFQGVGKGASDAGLELRFAAGGGNDDGVGAGVGHTRMQEMALLIGLDRIAALDVGALDQNLGAHDRLLRVGFDDVAFEAARLRRGGHRRERDQRKARESGQEPPKLPKLFDLHVCPPSVAELVKLSATYLGAALDAESASMSHVRLAVSLAS